LYSKRALLYSTTLQRCTLPDHDPKRLPAITQPIKLGATEDSGGARLVVLSDKELLQERVLPLHKHELRLGRGQSCDICFQDESVSTAHAVLRRAQDHWELEDLESTNGSYIGDQRIQRVRLKDGDILRLGKLVLKFFDGEGIESSYHRTLRNQMDRDSFTGVYNRRFAEDLLVRELARCARQKRSLTIAMLDLDNFKLLNDTHGHPAGDMVLKTVTQALVREAGRHDFVTRYGGEEFLIICVDSGREAARDYAERVRVAIAGQRVDYEGCALTVTASIGLASVDEGVEKAADELLAEADENLYRAKHAGKNLVVG
jgi:two-component system, cell cycle response regulator